MNEQQERLLQDEIDEQFELDFIKQEHSSLLYWLFFISGIAMLLPWNIFITASEFFSSRFDGSAYHTTFQNHFSAYFNSANLISLGILILTKPVRVEIPLCINLITFLFYAVSSLIPMSSTLYFWITIGFIVLMGITTSMLQASVVAEASQLSPMYVQAIMSGQGVAGVSVSLLSFLTTMVSRHYAAFLSFLYGFAVTCVAFWGRRIKLQSRPEIIRMTPEQPRPQQHVWDVIVRGIPGYIGTVIYIYVITLALFPSKTVHMIQGPIVTSLHFLVFNVGDWVGRTMPIWTYCQVFSSRSLLLLALGRTLFIPLFLHVHQELLFFGFLLLFSVSNGWLTSLVFMAAPQHQPEPSLIGKIMSFFLVVGLALGGLMSFIL